MKTYERILPILGIIMGLLGLLVTLSFRGYDACEFANNNAIFIKNNTKTALEAENLEMAKYHAYKALKSVDTTEDNISDCGCEKAVQTITEAGENLKLATKSTSFKDSKTFLNLAYQNIIFTLEALREFEPAYSQNYGDDILVMNTKEVLNDQGGVLLNPRDQLKESMNASLLEFETSLSKVVEHVDCGDAFNFINKIMRKSERHLKEHTLTPAQRHYHTQVKAIAYNALLQLEGCPVK